ncbi:MAG: SCP2 sterol-binding domain-containing protein, partial [Myxococcota bacterium]
ATDGVTRFFVVGLPFFAVRNLNTYFSHEGRIAFDIDGAGKWTLRFAHEEPVVKGLDPAAELRLSMSKKTFEAWLEGELEPSTAVGSGALKAKGDVSLLVALGQLLRDESTALGWETAE